MAEQTALEVDVEPAELRAAGDVVVLCQRLGLVRDDAFDNPAWERWTDPPQWVSVRFDRSGESKPGQLQVHVGWSSGFFAIFCANGRAIPAPCVRATVEQIQADARARDLPDLRTVAAGGERRG
nr:hypothetical protein [Pseudonocardia sp. AL041005-10]